MPKGPSKRKRVFSQYDREYQARPEQVAKRVRRNKARRTALKNGTVKKGDKRDVHHPKGNAKGPTRVISRSKNRSMK